MTIGNSSHMSLLPSLQRPPNPHQSPYATPLFNSTLITSTMTLIPIPEDLLKHPSISAHPKIPALAAAGGVSLDDADSMADVLAFTHEVAAHNVHPDHMRRSDPSPRRSARVLRGELLGHRSPSRSRSRDSRGGSETASAGRYRSRSRPPTTIIEERVGRRGRAGTIGGDEEEEDLKTRIAILEARHENGVRVLLGEKLVPVHKGSKPDLPVSIKAGEVR